MEEIRQLSTAYTAYLEYCYYQKNLNPKTLKSYSMYFDDVAKQAEYNAHRQLVVLT